MTYSPLLAFTHRKIGDIEMALNGHFTLNSVFGPLCPELSLVAFGDNSVKTNKEAYAHTISGKNARQGLYRVFQKIPHKV